MIIASEKVLQWIKEQQAKHVCACGCTSTIHIIRKHYYEGIPRFIAGHQSSFVARRGRLIPTKEEIQSPYEKGLTFKEIGSCLGWSDSFIQKKAVEYGIVARHIVTESHKERIRQTRRALFALGKLMMPKGSPRRKKGYKQSEEEKRKRASSLTGLKRTPQQCAKISIGVKKAMQCPEMREQKKKAARRAWRNPEIAARQIAAMWLASQRRPNKAEEYLTRILESLYPSEYKFVGDGSIIIDRLNPDFINVNGQKKIIELFGERFHRPGGINKTIPVRRTAHGRCEAFAKFGYRTLIVWWKELRNEAKLIEKIRIFHQQSSFAAGQR